MIIYFLNQVGLAGFNLINSRLDAYRILKNKTIAHGINFGSYLTFSIVLYWLTIKPVFAWSIFPYTDFAIFLMSAFCNRQGSFDIPLNLRRHLAWDYVSKDNPPKAWLDRQEIKLFGYDGKAPFIFYGIIWIVCSVVKCIWL
jgi:hypothetical protein